MSGKKGRSGRQKTIPTLINEAIDGLRSDLPELFQALKLKATNGDREALIYLIDRAIGKPKQQTELDIKGGVELSVGTVTKIYEVIAGRRRELDSPLQLGEGDAPIKEEESGQNEGDKD